MATYTVEAFRWSGTGYNALYNTSYTAVLDDNDGSFQGGSDASETVAINGGAAGSTNSLPYAINVSFTDTLGNPHVETFFFFQHQYSADWVVFCACAWIGLHGWRDPWQLSKSHNGLDLFLGCVLCRRDDDRNGSGAVPG